MSTKTILNRIAKVAVAALLGGFLTVVSAPLANAAAGDIELNRISTGVCAVSDTAGYRTFDGNLTSTLSNPLTVQVVPGGVVSFSNTDSYFTATSGPQTTVNTTLTLHSSYGLWGSGIERANSLTITANSAGTTTITTYATTAPFSAVNTVGNTTPTGKIVIKVVAACAASTFSTTYSGVQVDDEYLASPSFTGGDLLTFGAGDRGYINIVAKNSYNAVVPATTAWAVSATNGALVKIGTGATIDDTTTTDGTNSFASTTAAGTNISVRVAPANEALGGTTTVTVQMDGATVATKTLTFLPEAASIEVVKVSNGSNNGSGAFLYQLKSASGVVVPGSVSAVSTSLTPRISAVSSIKSGTVLPAVISTGTNSQTINGVKAGLWFLGDADGTTTYGAATYTCQAGSGTGTGTVTLKHTSAINATVITKDVTLSCSGGTSTYSVSTDKASYKVGEIATITIEAKDSTGAAVSDFTTVGASQSVTAGGGTLVKASADGDYFTSGKRTYQVQLTTAGSFNAVVNLPASIVTKSATAAYTVTDGAVSNAEVLAAIVKLIASINKQIKALQKQLKR